MLTLMQAVPLCSPTKNEVLMMSPSLPRKPPEIPNCSMLNIPARKLRNILGHFVQIKNECYLIVDYLCQISPPSSTRIQ